ncbi:MAG: hypothetical protein HZB56_19225 [Deltaproteobacteria bacterium]|nr:hypothetical protein [Deltaproteobacteria bacterium]
MKTYELRSSAIRAARNAGLADDAFDVIKVWQKGGKSSWRYVAKGESPVATEESSGPADEQGSTPEAQAPALAEPPAAIEVPPVVTEPTADRVRESTIEKPTKAVWAIADEMKAANTAVTRKEIVNECVRRGVAFYTARTQYQLWRKSLVTPAT